MHPVSGVYPGLATASGSASQAISEPAIRIALLAIGAIAVLTGILLLIQG